MNGVQKTPRNLDWILLLNLSLLNLLGVLKCHQTNCLKNAFNPPRARDAAGKLDSLAKNNPDLRQKQTDQTRPAS